MIFSMTHLKEFFCSVFRLDKPILPGSPSKDCIERWEDEGGATMTHAVVSHPRGDVY